jgi:hypothetical protein
MEKPVAQTPENKAPDALLLITPQCPHCAQVMQGLEGLIKEGALSRLEIVNIVANPDPASERGVRTVPWTQIGPFVLEGAHSPGELRNWAERASTTEGMAWYFDEQLKAGGLARVEQMVREDPARLEAIVLLAADSNTAMQTRVGIAALLEGIEGTGMAQTITEQLIKITSHPDARVRADACHYLALTENPDALPPLKTCLDDSDAVVREIASESIEHLEQRLK